MSFYGRPLSELTVASRLPPALLAKITGNIATKIPEIEQHIVDERGRIIGNIFQIPKLDRKPPKEKIVKVPDTEEVKKLKNLIKKQTAELAALKASSGGLKSVPAPVVKEVKYPIDTTKDTLKKLEFGPTFVSKVDVMDLSKINEAFNELKIEGLKSSPVKVKKLIAKQIEKETGVPFNQITKKVDIPTAAISYAKTVENKIKQILKTEGKKKMSEALYKKLKL